jgi:hypothetical protein
MMRRGSSGSLTKQRLEELGREVGALLIAFAPLDFVLGGGDGSQFRSMLLFLLLGALLYMMAVITERRRRRVD